MGDKPKILFELTDEHLETGMRGIPVGYCVTSRVDPIKGLFYIEKPIKELACLRPEEVIFLLMQGALGKGPDFDAFCLQLRQRATLDPKVRKHICQFPREAHPMKLLVAALAILGGIEGEGRYPEDCLNIIAKIPEVIATIINYHAGWGETPESRPELGYIENFCYMLNVPTLKDKKTFTEIMKLYNILHYDHGGGNLSVFVGKAVASGLEDMYGSVAAAMCALAGPRHGKANQDSLEFVKDIYQIVGDNPSEQDVEKAVRDRLEQKELIFGFGHAVLRAEDARATIFYEAAKKYYPNHPLVKVGLLLRTEAPKVLKENPKITNPYPNVDAMSGALLCAAGFDYPEYFTTLFGLSRVVGIARQIVYERLEAREGKGTPIVRPKYIYKPQR